MSDTLLPPRVIRVLDFETSGGEPPDADIIEVGWCDITETQAGWRVSGPKSILVKPTRPIEIEAMAVHHIQAADLEDAVDRDAALARVNLAGAAGPIVAFAAHGAETETQLWPEAAGEIWLDTYKLALRLLPDSPRHSLQVLRYYAGLVLVRPHAVPAHRAGPDAYVTAALLARVLEMTSLDEATAISREPAILPRIPFGRHFGTRWEDMDDGFLHWVLGTDMRPDILGTARWHLDKREREYQEERAAAERDHQPADEGEIDA